MVFLWEPLGAGLSWVISERPKVVVLTTYMYFILLLTYFSNQLIYVAFYMFVVSVACGVSGSGSGELGHYGSHPRPQVVDRGTPSRMDKIDNG